MTAFFSYVSHPFVLLIVYIWYRVYFFLILLTVKMRFKIFCFIYYTIFYMFLLNVHFQGNSFLI